MSELKLYGALNDEEREIIYHNLYSPTCVCLLIVFVFISFILSDFGLDALLDRIFQMFCSVSIVVCVMVVSVCVPAFSAFGISRSVVCGFEKSLFCACSRCGLGLRNAMFIDCYVLFGGYDHYFLSSKYILNSIAFYRASKHHLEHYICSPEIIFIDYGKCVSLKSHTKMTIGATNYYNILLLARGVENDFHPIW